MFKTLFIEAQGQLYVHNRGDDAVWPGWHARWLGAHDVAPDVHEALIAWVFDIRGVK